MTQPMLSYDPSGVLIEETGLREQDFETLAPKLENARREVLADAAVFNSGAPVPAEKVPLDAGFIELPNRLLAEYDENGPTSELGRIIAAGNALAEQVDRLVVLGIGGSYMGFRALVEARCHPYHNELSRGQRAGRPRVYFQGNNVDNDATAGLLDLLDSDKPADDVDPSWGIVVISKSGGTLETAVAFRQFLAALRRSCGDDAKRLAERIVPVTGRQGKLRDLSTALGCPRVFDVPDGVGGRFSILSAVGLVPAAAMGLDVVALLRGAAEMNRRFCDEPLGRNPVLDYVGVGHLMETLRGANIRVTATWGSALESAGLWYDQLLAESLGKEGLGATPLTMVNTRDLHSRQQQHQEGTRDKLITNLIVEQPGCDRIVLEKSEFDQDELNRYAGKTMPDLLAAALAGTNRSLADDRRPTADLRLAQLDETALGELFQMLMLATVVEGRLLGINPYGQPGVEGYKKRMGEMLGG